MSEPEVQPLAARVFGISQVVILLCLGQCIPFLVSLLISPDIVELDRNDENNIVGNNPEQCLVSSPVERGIGRRVDLNVAKNQPSCPPRIEMKGSTYVG